MAEHKWVTGVKWGSHKWSHNYYNWFLGPPWNQVDDYISSKTKAINLPQNKHGTWKYLFGNIYKQPILGFHVNFWGCMTWEKRGFLPRGTWSMRLGYFHGNFKSISLFPPHAEKKALLTDFWGTMVVHPLRRRFFLNQWMKKGYIYPQNYDGTWTW